MKNESHANDPQRFPVLLENGHIRVPGLGEIHPTDDRYRRFRDMIAAEDDWWFERLHHAAPAF